MRLLHSLRGRCLMLMRICGYQGDALFFGVRFPVRLAPSPTIIRHLDAQRYERAETLLVRQFLPPGATVLELGGSLGIVSSVILGGRPLRLVTYEAVPAFAVIGRQVVAHNFPSADYVCINEAVGPVDVPEVTFHWSPDQSLAGSAGTASSEGLGLIRVPAVDLASAVARHGIAPGAWLVADIEGMEFELLLNQSGAFAPFAGVIMECHDGEYAGRHRDQREVETMLASVGFRLLRRIGPVICMAR